MTKKQTKRFHTRHKDCEEIVKTLEKISDRGESFHRVFDNFLDLIVYAVSQQEEKYMEVIERIKDDRQEGERNIDYYTQAFSQLVEGMENNQLEDLLGDIFENRVSLGQNGQFFTPQSVSDVTAKMSYTGEQENLHINDPTCGSGRVLLSAAKVSKNNIFSGFDLDNRCMKMALINLFFNGLWGYVVQTNTISMKVYQGYEITFKRGVPKVRPLQKDEMEKLVKIGLENENNY